MAVNWLLIVYTVEGGLGTFVNALIVAAILRYKKLRERKELIAIGSLALADAGNAAGFLVAGIQRSYYMQQGTIGEPANSWQCFRFYNVLWYVSLPAAMMMLLIVSLDRLLATAAPLKYFTMDKKYTFLVCGGLWAFQMLQIPVLAAISYSNRHEPPTTRFCFGQDGVLEPWYATYLFACGPVFGSLGIVVYIMVVIIQVLRTKRQANARDLSKSQSEKRIQRKQEEDMKKQGRLMVTLGISSAFTLMLVIIPFAINTLLVTLGDKRFTPYSALLTLLNPMLNMLLYIWRHREMRAAVRGVLTCASALPIQKISTSVTPAPQTNTHAQTAKF